MNPRGVGRVVRMVVLVCCLSLPLSASRSAPYTQAAPAARFSVLHPAPRSYPTTALLVQDDQTTWVGTDHGLARLTVRGGQVSVGRLQTAKDGLPSDTITGLARDTQGRLWVGTDKGLARSTRAGRWHVFPLTPALLNGGRGLGPLVVDRQNRLWAATADRVLRYSEGPGQQGGQGTWEQLPPFLRGVITGMVLDKQGRVWVATAIFTTPTGNFGGLSFFDEHARTWRTVTSTDGYNSYPVTALTVDSQGRIWIGSDRDIEIYNGRSLKPFGPARGLNRFVTALTFDRQGRLWVGVAESYPFVFRPLGLVRYDQPSSGGGRGLPITTRQGLPSDKVDYLAADRQGRVWAGTANGVGVFQHNQAQPVLVPPGLPDSCIAQLTASFTSPDLWIGAGEGLSVYDGSRLSHLSGGSGYPPGFDPHNALAVDTQNQVWVVTTTTNDSGPYTLLTIYDSRHNRWQPLDENGDVEQVLADPQGHVWLGYSGGAIEQRTTKRVQPTPLNGSLPGNVAALAFQQGAGTSFRLWASITKQLLAAQYYHSPHGPAGPFVTGLEVYDGTRWQIIPTQGLAADELGALAVDQQGRAWVVLLGDTTTYGETVGRGLGVYDGQRWQVFTTAQGLPDTTVNTLTVDRKGRIWVGTDNGLAVYTPGAPTPWQTFTTRQGLPNNTVKALTLDARGQVWIGTCNGLARYTGA